MKDKTYNVAIVGATGVVGEAFLELLKERNFPIEEIHAIASEKSAGKNVMFGNKKLVCKNVSDFDFSGVDFAFFSAGRDVSREFAPIAAAKGCMVIDNTSEFRYDDDIPLIVPEVNSQLLAELPDRRIIANPNCSVVQLAVAINPLVIEIGVERINVATYQSVSGAGNAAIEELARQTASLLNGQDAVVETLPQQIAFNVIPHIDTFEENGYTREEMKMILEVQKIFSDKTIGVNPTAVRVPVFYGHSEAVNVELKQSTNLEEIKELLLGAPGVAFMDIDYATPVTHAANQEPVFVSRLRQDLSHPNAVNMWVVSDNVRKGAALNAVQIAELLVNRDRVMH